MKKAMNLIMVVVILASMAIPIVAGATASNPYRHKDAWCLWKCRFLGLWLTALCLRAGAVRPLRFLLCSFLQQPPAFRAKDAFITEAVFLDQHLFHASVIGGADQFLLQPFPQIVNGEQVVAQSCISVMTLFCR